MKKSTTLLALLLACVPSVITFAADATYHHIHLRASDTAAAAQWYATHMGGEATKLGSYDAVKMSSALLILFPEDQPGVDRSKHDGELLGSEGTAVDHIGFSFKDLAAKMKSFEEAGIEILQEPRDVGGMFKYGFVRDPWGTKIEVMEDPELYGFHHVHLFSKDPDEDIKWYQEIFGGEITTYKGLAPLPSIKYGDMWLIASKTDKELAPTTMHRSMDHLGWGFTDLAAELKRFKERGEKLPLDLFDYRGTNIAFIESPNGALIELVEIKK